MVVHDQRQDVALRRRTMDPLIGVVLFGLLQTPYRMMQVHNKNHQCLSTSKLPHCTTITPQPQLQISHATLVAPYEQRLRFNKDLIKDKNLAINRQKLYRQR
jgi:hypothetical protein